MTFGKCMKTIVLFSPSPQLENIYRGAPLSLLQASILSASANFPILIITSNLYSNPLQVLRDALDSALLVGISSMTGFQIKGAIEASKMVKANSKNMPVVWGGWHPTLCPDNVLTKKYVDFVVRGPGEESLMQLAIALHANSGQYEAVPGLCWKQAGNIKKNPRKPVTYDDSWPLLPYHLIDAEKCLTITGFGDRVMDYISSFGCPYHCSFCAEEKFSQHRWVSKSANRTLDEILYLKKKHNIDGISMKDSNFFVNKKRALQIAQMFTTLPKPFSWGLANTRTDIMLGYSDEEWRLLKNSGLKSMLIGAESGSDESLKFIRKEATVEQTRRFCEVSKKHGISACYSFFTGYPWISGDRAIDINYVQAKNREHFEKTINLMAKIVNRGSSNNYLFFKYNIDI